MNSSCEYMKYNGTEKYFPRLYCAIDDKTCIFAKRCEKEEKFIPNGELWKDCFKMIEERRKNIPKDSYYVQAKRPNKKGHLYLYVYIDGNVERISTTLTELNQDYVYLKETIDSYEVSLVPFKNAKKQRN